MNEPEKTETAQPEHRHDSQNNPERHDLTGLPFPHHIPPIMPGVWWGDAGEGGTIC